MITNNRVNYAFSFCRGATYAAFVSGVRDGSTVSRLCFIGVEGLRAYLSLHQGVPSLSFFRKAEKTWEHVTRVPRERRLDLRTMLHDARGFESELVETFFYAYPRAEESYYDDMPNHADILTLLYSAPTESRAKELRLICSWDEQTTVDDADGVVTIVCEDGTVCIPYDTCKRERVFQLERAKFHPDSFFAAVAESFFDKCYAVKSRVQSLTFSGVMSRIENFMP